MFLLPNLSTNYLAFTIPAFAGIHLLRNMRPLPQAEDKLQWRCTDGLLMRVYPFPRWRLILAPRSGGQAPALQSRGRHSGESRNLVATHSVERKCVEPDDRCVQVYRLLTIAQVYSLLRCGEGGKPASTFAALLVFLRSGAGDKPPRYGLNARVQRCDYVAGTLGVRDDYRPFAAGVGAAVQPAVCPDCDELAQREAGRIADRTLLHGETL